MVVRFGQQTAPMQPRTRLVAGALAGALTLAACGGGDDGGSGAQPGDPLPAVDDTGGDTAVDATPGPLAEGAGFVDLVGAEVVPAAEIPSNLLPDVIIDDLTNDRKVNFRNLVPQDKPILLWMYAPH